MRRICTVALLIWLTSAQAQGPGVTTDLLRTQSDEGDDLQRKGDYTGAARVFSACSEGALSIGDSYWSSICLQLLGGVERLQGKYDEAEVHYKKALEYAYKPGGEKRVSFVMNNLAGIYMSQARYSEALALLKQAAEYSASHGIPNDAAPVQNSAIIYAMQGDLARALQSFNAALRIYESLNDTRKIALTHYNIGILQLKQTNYAAAAYQLEIALALAEKATDKTQIAQALSDLGRVRDLQGKPREALEAMNRALRLSTEMGFRQGEADTFLNLGNFHSAHREFDAAAKSFESAASLNRELRDDYGLGIAVRGLGYVAQQRGDYAAADRYASTAADEAHRIGDMQGEWQALALGGLASRQLKNLPQARERLSRAAELIERQRGLVGGGDVEKQRFFEEAVYPYHELASIEVETKNPLAALQAAERARARVLLDLAESGPDRVDRYMTDAERADESKFRRQIAVAKSAPAKERARLFESYQAFLADLYVKHPELRTLRGESTLVRQEDLARLIPDSKTAIIEYLCGADETLIFAITQSGIRALRIPLGREALAKRSEQYRTALEGRDPAFRATASALYATLVQPIAKELAGKNRVYLVPDGPLWSLPFQTLGNASRYWIEDAAISYAPSIAFLRDRSAPAPQSAHQKDLLALAIPELGPQTRRIAALYAPSPVDVKIGPAANEAAFRANAPQARIIHIAAHGEVDSGSGLHSRLMLTPSQEGDDGWLEAWELMRMELRADLVVLSACETGRGHAVDGEGLVGLTWALFIAGAKGAVVSQWRVESESTTEIMVALHRAVRQGQPPALALRSAVLSVMNNEKYRHPMYWGAFVASGM